MHSLCQPQMHSAGSRQLPGLLVNVNHQQQVTAVLGSLSKGFKKVTKSERSVHDSRGQGGGRNLNRTFGLWAAKRQYIEVCKCSFFKICRVFLDDGSSIPAPLGSEIENKDLKMAIISLLQSHTFQNNCISSLSIRSISCFSLKCILISFVSNC